MGAVLHFCVNARSSPERVGEAHFTDEIPNLIGYRGSPFQPATLPIPIQSEAQAMTVSGLTRSNAERQSFHNRESQTHRKCGRPSGDGACAHGSIAARPRADGGEQESLFAEQRGLGNNLAERKGGSAWPGKATGRDLVNAMISMCTDFLVGATSHLRSRDS